MLASRLRATGESTTSGLSRMTRNPPALMMPACIRAETGVGASIVSGSQLWKGNWADLVMAASTNRAPIAETKNDLAADCSCRATALAKTSV
jgi:hypothetical protein